MKELIFILIILGVYFLPSLIAYHRKHQNKVPILVVNSFLGWTFIGWFVSFVWSLTCNIKNPEIKK